MVTPFPLLVNSHRFDGGGHLNNCFELSDGRLVVDTSVTPDNVRLFPLGHEFGFDYFDSSKGYNIQRTGNPEMLLTRFILTPATSLAHVEHGAPLTMTRTTLLDRHSDFPSVNPAYYGRQIQTY